jgi:ABC-type methionine transport system ATPase subunit
MIVVTHEISFARDIADHVLFMDGGQVAERGPAAEVLVRPTNARTRAFLSRFHGTIAWLGRPNGCRKVDSATGPPVETKP